MSREQKIIKTKVGLLELARQLGKLPVILIDEIAAEVREKYEVPPALKR